MALPRRSAARRRGGSGASGLRPGAVLSVLLHLGFAALVVLASLGRDKPPEPASPPSYTVQFEGGSPERPAAAEVEPPPAEVAAPDPEPAVESSAELPVPDAPSSPPEAPAAPAPPEQASTAEAEPPRQEAPAPAEPPPPPEEASTAEAEPPPPSDEVLPVPPPAPPRPQKDAALTAPPRPARPVPPPEPLPGLFLPEARRLQPLPQPSFGPRPRLDLSPTRPAQPGREGMNPNYALKGAHVGPDWHSALRQWWIDHRRPPPNVDLLESGGSPTVEMVLAQDGRVLSVRLVRPSGSIWLDAGALRQFRGAVLPALPPPVDASGAVLTFTIDYILIR